MSHLLLDVRHAVRLFLSHPGWTLVAILSLALGIAVNTTAFSIADAMFLRPLPVEKPAEIMRIDALAELGREVNLSYPELADLSTSDAFRAVAGYSGRGALLDRGGEMEMLPVYVVTPNFFEFAGVRALLGRTLLTSEDADLAGQPSVVISHSLWESRFNSDPAMAGRTIRLSGQNVVVVGVLPPSFPGLERHMTTAVFFSPAAWSHTRSARAEFTARDNRIFEVLARVDPAVPRERIKSTINTISKRLAAAYPATNRNVVLRGSMTDDDSAGGGVRPAVLALAIAGLVLWIACGNVAGLLLAQAEGRRREIAMRQALGASRGRLVRQMLVESAVLAVPAALTGLLLFVWLLRAVPLLLPPGPFSLDFHIRFDMRVLVFTITAIVVTVFLFGLAPAVRAARTDIVAGIKDARGSGSRLAWRSAIVAVQIGVGVVLLYTSALFFRSLNNVSAAPLGFDPSRNILAVLMNPGTDLPRERLSTYYAQIRDAAAAMPGVRRASFARRLPMGLSGGGATVMVEFPGRIASEAERQVGIRYNQIEPGFLDTIGTPLLKGRGFTPADNRQSARVAIVSEALVAQFFSKGDPLDNTVLVEGQPTRIVGIAANARVNSIHEKPRPFLYFPFDQLPSGEATLVLETAGDPAAVLAPLKKVIASAAPGSFILAPVTMRQHMKLAIYEDWIRSVLAGGIAFIGVTLAAVGLFAAVAYGAARRTREFGVRLAIGAASRDLSGLVLRHAIRHALFGLILGIPAALAAARLFRSTLVGVTATDPLSLLASAGIALGVTLLAGLWPALNASRTDPLEALRYE